MTNQFRNGEWRPTGKQTDRENSQPSGLPATLLLLRCMSPFTFETCRPTPGTSVYGGRPEVSGALSNRRDGPDVWSGRSYDKGVTRGSLIEWARVRIMVQYCAQAISCSYSLHIVSQLLGTNAKSRLARNSLLIRVMGGDRR
jgi:hypothetical protein